MFDQQQKDLFWANVSKPQGESGCWFYALVRYRIDGKKSVEPHRAAYMMAHGEIPAGQVVRHLCDSRRCVNPAHLRAGTQRENMWDYSIRRMFAVEPGELIGYEDVPEYIPPPNREKHK